MIALLSGLSTLLSAQHWFRFVFAATSGTFAGITSASILFPSNDMLARSYVGLGIILGTLSVFTDSLLTSAVARWVFVLRRNQERAAWIMLICCVSFGPVLLAVTPMLVAHRVVHNDLLARQRFTSLKTAVENGFRSGGKATICDGQTLAKLFHGPTFSELDWERITGNYVKQDGYLFMIYCHEKGGYTIDVRPARAKGDGTKHLCTDESGRMGCAVEWNRSRYACTACTR